MPASLRDLRPQSAPLLVAVAPSRRLASLQMSSANEAPGVTNVRYWDDAASDWDSVHDTFVSDTSGVIRRVFARHLGRTDDVIDFGCGGGRYLAFLSARCRSILGIDISAKLCAIAQKDVVDRRHLTNVTIQCADLGASSAHAKLSLPRCDACVCTNVLISPEPTTRANILTLMASSVRPGGRLLLLVPATGSALNIRTQHTRWLRERRKRGYKPCARLEAPEGTSAADERHGIFQRAGVRTKHYRLAEVQALLSAHGFTKVLAAERVQYSWDSEFDPPTRFLDRDAAVRRPFDWLLVAERDTLTTPTSTARPATAPPKASRGVGVGVLQPPPQAVSIPAQRAVPVPVHRAAPLRPRWI